MGALSCYKLHVVHFIKRLHPSRQPSCCLHVRTGGPLILAMFHLARSGEQQLDGRIGARRKLIGDASWMFEPDNEKSLDQSSSRSMEGRKEDEAGNRDRDKSSRRVALAQQIIRRGNRLIN